MKLIAAYLARIAVNELANSALPHAPVVPEPPKCSPFHRLAGLIRSEPIVRRTRGVRDESCRST